MSHFCDSPQITRIHGKSRQFPVRSFSVFARTPTYTHPTDASKTMSASPACGGVTRVGVTPGAATEGVTPIFSHHRLSVLHSHPYLFSPEKLTTFFAHHCQFYWVHSGVIPLMVSPSPFLRVRPRLSSILTKFTYKFFFVRVSPPGGCHAGRSPTPPLVTPLPAWPLQKYPMVFFHTKIPWNFHGIFISFCPHEITMVFTSWKFNDNPWDPDHGNSMEYPWI